MSSLTGKECLKEIVNNFYHEIGKLSKSYDSILNSHPFFVTHEEKNNDCTKITARKVVIEHLLKFTEKLILTHSRDDLKKYMPVSYSISEKAKHLQAHIDTLTEEECRSILTEFLNDKLQPIMAAKNYKKEILNDTAEYMTAGGQRKALSSHNYNDKWLFYFIAKLVILIQETLGLKTSSEKLVEKSISQATLSLK
ncbi:hypothetical protein [Legionella fairfieldensis]|uniref:hypothetical protein n=1 Tax=Legionella fairfieldensis TaxID=45064 RepID=UPI00048B2B76|nr:hypothetical protein [Legionella fairfieldensis]